MLRARPVLCLIWFAVPAVAGAQSFPVDSIVVEGTRNLTAAAVAAASGLRPGEPANSAAFDAARDRLLASGYFDTVAYHYKPAAATSDKPAGYDITFDVQEVTAMFPIRVDGLPTNLNEVTALLKAKDPLFTGKMPGTPPVLNRAAAEIERWLGAQGHPGKVAGRVIANTPNHFEIDFTPERGLPAVSAVSFEGSKLISGIDLHNKISEVAFGQPFTEEGFRALLESQISPLYEAKGYMKVTYPKIVSQPSTEVDGVDVKVTVNEGVEYKLTRVAVFGKSPEESARILRSAKIPQLTVANFEEVRQAATRVQESMRHQGYLDASVTTDKEIDDAKKTVEFFLVVDGGPVYTFGKLTVEGLSLDGEAAIRKMWSLKPGDAFPEGYPNYFLSKVKEEGIFDHLGDTKASQDISVEHVVDVALDFKAAPPKEKTPQRQGPPGVGGRGR